MKKELKPNATYSIQIRNKRRVIVIDKKGNYIMSLLVLICLRCNHNWIARTEKPRFCPKCKSLYWDKERKRIKEIKQLNDKKGHIQ